MGAGGRARRAGTSWNRPPLPRGRARARSEGAPIPLREAETGNRLLDAIPDAERTPLLREGETVPLLPGDVLFDPGEPIRRVLFVQEGVVSIVAGQNGGPGVEYSAVGREGMIGLPLFLGAESYSNARVATQVAGRALGFDAELFAEHSGYGRALHGMLLRYGQYLLDQASQTAACNSVHSIEQRCAKWLLIINDRMDEESWSLPDEFLGDMLGVAEPAVRMVARELDSEEIIRDGAGGLFEILDRDGLESLACDCYRVGRDAYSMVGAP